MSVAAGQAEAQVQILRGRAPHQWECADVAQLVELHPSKVNVAGSSPVVRSRLDLLAPQRDSTLSRISLTR